MVTALLVSSIFYLKTAKRPSSILYAYIYTTSGRIPLWLVEGGKKQKKNKHLASDYCRFLQGNQTQEKKDKKKNSAVVVNPIISRL